MLSHLLFKDKLTILFCLLDDFLALLPKPNRALISGRNPAGRPANLTPSEVLTLALFRFWTTLGNWKAFYALMHAGFRQEFPKLPCYETLLRQINAHAPLGLLLLIALLGRQEGPGTYALDATAIPVSRHRRQAKVLRQWAAWSKDSDRHWFFGFKLHAVCDPRGQLLSLRITPGNVADVTQAEALLSQLRGLVVADAAYISTPRREKLWELGLLLLTPLRKNMKGLASLEQTQHFSRRSIIETVFSLLKDRLGLVTSLPRSWAGYRSHYVLVLLAYQLGRWGTHALFSPALPHL
jgi:IS5 family transposase